MAADHEGWYLKANVDISSLLQANKATDELFKSIKKVDGGFSGLHGNDALAKSIKSADIEIFKTTSASVKDNIDAFIDGKLPLLDEIHAGFHGHGGN